MKHYIMNGRSHYDSSYVRGIYDHEQEVFMECEALKEAANSIATHDNLLYPSMYHTLVFLYCSEIYSTLKRLLNKDHSICQCSNAFSCAGALRYISS